MEHGCALRSFHESYFCDFNILLNLFRLTLNLKPLHNPKKNPMQNKHCWLLTNIINVLQLFQTEKRYDVSLNPWSFYLQIFSFLKFSFNAKEWGLITRARMADIFIDLSSSTSLKVLKWMPAISQATCWFVRFTKQLSNKIVTKMVKLHVFAIFFSFYY